KIRIQTIEWTRTSKVELGSAKENLPCRILLKTLFLKVSLIQYISDLAILLYDQTELQTKYLSANRRQQFKSNRSTLSGTCFAEMMPRKWLTKFCKILVEISFLKCSPPRFDPRYMLQPCQVGISKLYMR